MEFRFDGKVALITGSGHGIGKVLAFAFAEAGANVVVNALHFENADSTAGEINARGWKAIAIGADVSKNQDIDLMVGKVLDKFGRIDILVNNAGVNEYVAFTDVTEEQWDRIINTNLKGVFLVSKAVVEQMKKQGGGKIVNMSSMAGKTGFRFNAPYTSTKFGIIGLTQVMAQELGRYNINVNAVCPGVVETRMTLSEAAQGAKILGVTTQDVLNQWAKDTPLGRLSQSEDVIGVTLFLCSNAAAFITGEAINVTGGLEMH